jgi:pimeloyl-ACP methyl ester carboxylesterase
VLVPGAAPEGKDDARLVALALALARKRFEVLVPDIEAVRALRIGAADAVEIADAVRHLGDAWGAAGEASVGVVAISYALGPAVLAALRPEARDEVRFIVGVGGYYDVVAAIAFFTTGRYRAPGEAEWRFRRPNEYGKWVFARSNADRLETPDDRRLLAELARRKLDDPAAEVAALAAALGPEGRSVWRLLVNTDPAEVPALVATLPPAIRGEIEALDLRRRDLAGLRARLLLLHGRDDGIIPYTESLALAAALPGQATLYIVDSLAHVDLGPADTLALWHAAYRLLEERDGVTPRP